MSAPVVAARVPWIRRVRLRLHHGWRLLREVGAFSVLNGAWWLLPLLVLVLAVALAAGAAQHTIPYAVYTLF